MSNGVSVTRTIRTRLEIDGEKEYKQIIADINRELKTHKAELALVESQYRGAANTSEALTAKGKALADILEKQQQRLSGTSQALQNAQRAQKGFADQAAAARAKLEALQAEMAALQKSSGDSGAAQAELTKKIADADKQLAILNNSYDAAGRSVENWQTKLYTAQKDINNTNFTLKENEKHLKEAAGAADGCATSIDRFGKATQGSAGAIDTLAAALAAAGVAATVKEIAATLSACSGAFIEFESAVTGVYKTVEGTPEQLAAITEGIKRLSTEIPATTTELAGVAEAAGQLGIATEDILSFTEVMTNLGVATNLSAEQAATQLAKFANITQMGAADFERLGSVIVALGNNFATTEADIVNMGANLAAAGSLVGVSEANIMGLAAALSSLGIEAQAGGTAISKLMRALETMIATGSDKLEGYARVAGMSAKEFAAVWEKDAMGALSKFINGLGDLDAAGGSSIATLDELGIKETRLIDAVLRLSTSGDLLINSIEMSNQAWQENIALTNEAALRYGTTESQIQLFHNAVNLLKIEIGEQLNPVIGAFAAAGKDAAEVVAKFVSENKGLVPLIAGLTAALALLAGGIAAVAIAQKVAIPAIAAFNAALAANPAGMVAMAIGLLVTALGPLIVHMATAKTEGEEFAASLNKMRQAHADNIAAIEKEAAATLDILAVYEKLSAKTIQTEAEKQALLSVTEQLIKAVPELSEYYDEQAGVLNLTAEAVRNMAQAEAQRRLEAADHERIVQAYMEEEKAARNLAEAQARQAEALAKVRQAQAEGRRNYGADSEAYRIATKDVKGYIKAQEEARAEIESLSSAVNNSSAGTMSYAASLEKVSGLSTETAAATEQLENAQNNLTAATEQLHDTQNKLAAATKELIDKQEGLSRALAEQQKENSLSLETILALIEAGQEEYLVIDAVTGAVTLNTESVIEKQRAEIQAQAAAVLFRLATSETAEALLYSGKSALEAAKAYLKNAEAQELASGAQKSYAAQIAALSAMYDSLGKSAGGAAKATGGAAKIMKTQAQQDLAEFQRLKKELDHALKMGGLEQADYYARLADIRDRYLTDDSNIDTYRGIQETIFGFETKQIEEAEKAWKDHVKTVDAHVKELAAEAKAAWGEIQKQQDEVIKQQDSMRKKLEGYGNLFELDKKSGKAALASLDDQIKALNKYDTVMSELKTKLGDGLMIEIAAMGVDDAIAYGEQLLKKSAADLEKYNAAYEEKQQAAAEIAQKYYQGQVDELQAQRDEFQATMQEAMAAMEDTTLQGGKDALQALIDGMSSKGPEAINAAKRIAAEIGGALSNIPSGSTDGSHMAGLPFVPWDGYKAELHFGERVLTKEEAQSYISAAQPPPLQPQRPAPAQIDQQSIAAIINANSTLTAGLGGSGARRNDESGDVVFNIDGQTLARISLAHARRAAAQSPEIRSDF